MVHDGSNVLIEGLRPFVVLECLNFVHVGFEFYAWRRESDYSGVNISFPQRGRQILPDFDG